MRTLQEIIEEESGLKVENATPVDLAILEEVRDNTGFEDLKKFVDEVEASRRAALIKELEGEIKESLKEHDSSLSNPEARGVYFLSSNPNISVEARDPESFIRYILDNVDPDFILRYMERFIPEIIEDYIVNRLIFDLVDRIVLDEAGEEMIDMLVEEAGNIYLPDDNSGLDYLVEGLTDDGVISMV